MGRQIGDTINIDNCSCAIIASITEMVPVIHKDNGSEEWYEVVDPINAKSVLMIGENREGQEIYVLIDKTDENSERIVDFL